MLKILKVFAVGLLQMHITDDIPFFQKEMWLVCHSYITYFQMHMYDRSGITQSFCLF